MKNKPNPIKGPEGELLESTSDLVITKNLDSLADILFDLWLQKIKLKKTINYGNIDMNPTIQTKE
jgi:hypothetical protein